VKGSGQNPRCLCGLRSIAGVPNGNLRQEYLKAALVADSQEIVDVDMREIVAPLP
jgi:hypothetical protein